MLTISEAGNKGEKIRSDCHVRLELAKTGGLIISLSSRVKSLFGEQIMAQIKEIFSFFEIDHAKIEIEDSGALPFVIAARVEAAIKMVLPDKKSFILPLIPENNYTSSKDRFRFSRLYLPGNSPSMMLNAGIHHPNGIILDLEDSVAHQKKHEARYLVRNALCQVNFYGAERMVRINQLPLGLEDLAFVVPFNTQVILIPKCESGDMVRQVDSRVKEIQSETQGEAPIYFMPIIESCLGVENAFEIAKASENVIAVAIGLEDYTADLGVKRTEEGAESLYARSRIVNACKAAGIQPIDSVYSDVGNMDGLLSNVLRSKALGFEGMGCIHPRQIEVIHEGFKPGLEEIDNAKRIIAAFEEAEEKGLGVVSLGSKMIDPPVVKRAQQTMKLVEVFGLT